jgi:putative hydrolase of the HAD superfamily
MTAPPVRAVIFDFGGVFTTSPVENFAAYERAHGLPERFIGGVIKANLHHGAFARFERAEISFEEFDRLFAQETRAAGHEIRGDDFVRLLDVALKPEMVEALSRVKSAGLLTGCITNNFEGVDPVRSARRETGDGAIRAIFAAFDHVIESSKAGVRKPEPRIYEMMVKALGVAPANCIFLDDLGVNLKPARDMGMRTIKVPFGDVRPAIAELGRVTGLSLG